MRSYLVRRVILLAVVLFGVSIIAFVLTHLVPADPIIATLGEHARPEQVESLRRAWGLDLPLHIQYLRFAGSLLRGNLGVSIRTRRPVLDDIAHYFPATMELSTFAILISIAIGIPVGVLAATKRDSGIDHFTRITSLLGASMPIFWMGLMLLALLYYRFDVLPSSGRLSQFTTPPLSRTGLMVVDSILAGEWKVLADALWHLILPSFCLGYYSTAMIVRMTRSSMLEVIRHEYITTARAKGLSEKVVIYKHALKNALIPTVTVIGLSYGSLLSGAVLTESIFAWPGLGRYATNAMISVDVPSIMGVTVVVSVIYSLANLVVDLAYAFLNPTIRYE